MIFQNAVDAAASDNKSLSLLFAEEAHGKTLRYLPEGFCMIPLLPHHLEGRCRAGVWMYEVEAG